MAGSWEREGIFVQDRPVGNWAKAMFEEPRALIFVGAAGIAVRSIAPFVKDKLSDPPVVVVDETGCFVIPLLSGHMGGANDLARRIAGWLGAVPVITTATDLNGLFAVDVYASRSGLALSDRQEAKRISAALLAGEPVGFFSDFPVGAQTEAVGERGEGKGKRLLPPGCVDKVCLHNICITIGDRLSGAYRRQYGLPADGTLRLVPKAVVLGIGCRRGMEQELLEEKVNNILGKQGIDILAVKAAATIDIKQQEPGLRGLADRHGWEFRTYSREELEQVEGIFTESDFVRDTVGVGNVCERAAVAAGGTLLIHKQAGDGITVAAAMEQVKLPDFI